MDCQRVKFERAISGHTLEMAKMYACFSNINVANEMLLEYPLDSRTQEMVKLIERGAKQVFVHNYTNDNVVFVKRAFDDNSINSCIVCFSGGKDSTTAALMMREKGYDVHLYHVQGINKSYPDESERVKDIATHLNLPLIIERVTLKGKSNFPDNPVKNQLIASMALDYGVENGICTDVVFGDFPSTSVLTNSFTEAWSDCHEMFEEHEKFVRNFVPSYKIHLLNVSDHTKTLDIIASHKLIDVVQGCVLPIRYRNFTKQNNEKKYGIVLPPNRCGSCWKCCVEYIHYANTGVFEYNKDFYKHCLEVLVSKVGVLRQNVSSNIDDVYRAFLYDDFKNSKYYKNEYR